MNILDEIRNSKKNSKQLLFEISQALIKDHKLLGQIKEGLSVGSKVEKGILMESLEYASKDDPSIAENMIDTVVDYLDYEDSPRVKWEGARVIQIFLRDIRKRQFVRLISFWKMQKIKEQSSAGALLLR